MQGPLLLSNFSPYSDAVKTAEQEQSNLQSEIVLTPLGPVMTLRGHC